MNPVAKVYFDAFPIAEQEYGERGLKLQIVYFFSNVVARTAKQKQLKKELMRWAQSIE